MKIPREKIEEIANANDIVDVISNYIQVKKRGKNFLAICPFHPDKNPSLNISQEKQVYHCFSCGASGNIFKFVQEIEKITFVEAVEGLAQRAGISLSFLRSDKIDDEVLKCFEINKLTAKYFHNNLKSASSIESEFLKKYLKDRNIKDKTIEKFGLGYAKKEWTGLVNFFEEENLFKLEDVEKAGLIKKSEKENNKYYDRFRGRLIFPIFNENGKVVGFGGRKLYEEDELGKYLNSPETKIYNKSRILYGLNFAKEKIRYYDYVILVEGYMDLISLFQFGIENVVATSGTALTEEQVKLISRYTKNIIFIFDSDVAGVKASKRGIELVLNAGLELSIVTLPNGEDPDSFVNKFGKEEFENQIKKRKSIINFIADVYEKENKLSSAIDKAEFVREIITYISKIPDTIKRAFLIKEISNLYKLRELDLIEELDKYKKEDKRYNFINYSKSKLAKEVNKISDKSVTIDNISPEEKDLIEIFLSEDVTAISYLERNLQIDFLKNETVIELIQIFLDELVNEEKIVLANILNYVENESTRSLLAKLSINKYDISISEKADKYSILGKNIIKKSYYDEAVGIIDKLRKKKSEDELKFYEEELRKNPNDPDKIKLFIEKKREVLNNKKF